MRKALSENIITKYFCCCLRVKDQVDIPWEDMTVPQRKFRVKRLWIKARLVYHFIRMKQSANEGLNHQNNGKNEEDADVDLENINSQ